MEAIRRRSCTAVSCGAGAGRCRARRRKCQTPEEASAWMPARRKRKCVRGRLPYVGGTGEARHSPPRKAKQIKIKNTKSRVEIRGASDATWNDWARQDGREYGASADQERARMCRLRCFTEGRRGARQRES